MKLKILKLPIILGTIICLFYYLYEFNNTAPSLINMISSWLIISIVLLILNYFTYIANKAKKAGEKTGQKISNSIFRQASSSIQKEETNNNIDELNKESKNVIQEACNLLIIGEYVATFIAAIPLLIIIYFSNSLSHHKQLENWETILISFISFFWLILLEKRWKVRIYFPLIKHILKIPLKWIVIPIGIVLLFYK